MHVSSGDPHPSALAYEPMTDLRGDARLRQLQWRDLTTLTLKQKLTEVMISVPWLILSIAFFDRQWLALGAISAFMFFLTGLRQAHGAQYCTLGIPRRAQVEHHLFPAVPTARLPELAARVDRVMPHLRQHQVF